MLTIENITHQVTKLDAYNQSECILRIQLTVAVLNSSMQSASTWGLHFQADNSKWRSIDTKSSKYRPRVCAHGKGILLPDDVQNITCEIETTVPVNSKEVLSQFLGSEVYGRWKTMGLRLRPVSHNCIGPEVMYPSTDREIEQEQLKTFQHEIKERFGTNFVNWNP